MHRRAGGLCDEVGPRLRGGRLGLGAPGEDHQQAQPLRPAQGEVQPAQRLLVATVGVVQRQDQRAVRRQFQHQRVQAVQDLVAGPEPGRFRGVRAGRGEPGEQRRRRGMTRAGGGPPARALQHRHVPSARTLQEGAQQAGLAHAGGPGHHHQAGPAAARGRQPRLQRFQLTGAAGQRSGRYGNGRAVHGKQSPHHPRERSGIGFSGFNPSLAPQRPRLCASVPGPDGGKRMGTVKDDRGAGPGQPLRHWIKSDIKDWRSGVPGRPRARSAP